ncbi:MAG: 2-oxoacid:ferredoxin oxidoreductase subunit beta [Candidatus Marinimicrobia bacterium]|nr:2-oxoacid:ferredoxin oxidoreductase subunit beta [Candidatus Neomarinimicrobiota bacterium]
MTLPENSFPSTEDFFKDRTHRLLHYLRREVLPTAFCSGCGCGTVLGAFAQAMDELGLAPQEVALVTGIGCSSWIPSPYFKADTLHTTHGRPLAFATGVKIMLPDMKVIIIAGDGDIAGIGGNHLIHNARRNIDISVFMVNNWNYGMTGGQVSPTTPIGARTTTTPYKNIEPPLKTAELVAAAGANYVSRWTTYHVFPLMEAMQYAIMKKGFSFIEIISQCPVSYGKLVGMRTGSDFLNYFRDNSVKVEKAQELSEEELKDKIVIGKIVERDEEEFVEKLYQINEIQADKLGLKKPVLSPDKVGKGPALREVEGKEQSE